MNLKYIDAYVYIDKVFSSGIEDEEEIICLLKENCNYNYDGAVMALTSFLENKHQIKQFIKKNNLNSKTSTPIQMGE